MGWWVSGHGGFFGDRGFGVMVCVGLERVYVALALVDYDDSARDRHKRDRWANQQTRLQQHRERSM